MLIHLCYVILGVMIGIIIMGILQSNQYKEGE